MRGTSRRTTRAKTRRSRASGASPLDTRSARSAGSDTEPPAQLVGRAPQQAEVAAHRHEVESLLEVAAGVLLDGSEDADGLAEPARPGAGLGDRRLDLGMAGIAQVAEVGREVGRAHEQRIHS